MTAQPRAILAPHVALQLVDRRRLGPSDDVERDGLVGVAAEAAHFEIEVAGIEGIAEQRRGLRRPLVAEHPLVPGRAGEAVRFLARAGGLFLRDPDAGAVE